MGKIPTWNSEPTPGQLTIDGGEVAPDAQPLEDTTADKERAASQLREVRTLLAAALPDDPIITLLLRTAELEGRLAALTSHLLDGASVYETDAFTALSDEAVAVALLDATAGVLGGTSLVEVA